MNIIHREENPALFLSIGTGGPKSPWFPGGEEWMPYFGGLARKWTIFENMRIKFTEGERIYDDV